MSNSDERFDAAIDRAVREMLDVEPPADLRARVIDGIDRPYAFRRWIWIAAPLAAGAFLVLAIVLQPAPPRVVAVHQVARVQPLASRVTTAEQAPEATVARGEAPRSSRSSSRRVATSTNTGRTDIVAVAPIDPITPIHIADMRQSDITPHSIAIQPLAPVTEMQIAPLTPPEGRH